MMQVIRAELSIGEMTANGKTVGDNIALAEVLDPEVIRPLDKPVSNAGALAALHGNLAPFGAVIKPSAASERLMRHTGRALVFDSQPEMLTAMADPLLDCDENTVLAGRITMKPKGSSERYCASPTRPKNEPVPSAGAVTRSVCWPSVGPCETNEPLMVGSTAYSAPASP